MWTIRRQWQALIALALVACVANLFGPVERWWGVDIGATGAAVFYLCLVALLVLMALKGFIIVMAIAWGMAAHALGRGSGPVEYDERDLRLRFQADRVGDWAPCLAVVASVLLLSSVSAASLTWWLQPLVLPNLLIAVLIAKLLLEHAALVALYAHARR